MLPNRNLVHGDRVQMQSFSCAFPRAGHAVSRAVTKCISSAANVFATRPGFSCREPLRPDRPPMLLIPHRFRWIAAR